MADKDKKGKPNNPSSLVDTDLLLQIREQSQGSSNKSKPGPELAESNKGTPIGVSLDTYLVSTRNGEEVGVFRGNSLAVRNKDGKEVLFEVVKPGEVQKIRDEKDQFADKCNQYFNASKQKDEVYQQLEAKLAKQDSENSETLDKISKDFINTKQQYDENLKSVRTEKQKEKEAYEAKKRKFDEQSASRAEEIREKDQALQKSEENRRAAELTKGEFVQKYNSLEAELKNAGYSVMFGKIAPTLDGVNSDSQLEELVKKNETLAKANEELSKHGKTLAETLESEKKKWTARLEEIAKSLPKQQPLDQEAYTALKTQYDELLRGINEYIAILADKGIKFDDNKNIVYDEKKNELLRKNNELNDKLAKAAELMKDYKKEPDKTSTANPAEIFEHEIELQDKTGDCKYLGNGKYAIIARTAENLDAYETRDIRFVTGDGLEIYAKCVKVDDIGSVIQSEKVSLVDAPNKLSCYALVKKESFINRN